MSDSFQINTHKIAYSGSGSNLRENPPNPKHIMPRYDLFGGPGQHISERRTPADESARVPKSERTAADPYISESNANQPGFREYASNGVGESIHTNPTILTTSAKPDPGVYKDSLAPTPALTITGQQMYIAAPQKSGRQPSDKSFFTNLENRAYVPQSEA